MQLNVTVVSHDIRRGTSKAGKPYTIYKSDVRDEKGNQFSVSGFKGDLHNIQPGNAVSIDAEPSRYGGYDLKAVLGEVSSSGTSAPVAAAPAAQSHMEFPVEKNSRNTSIIRQNSLTNAVNLVTSTALVNEDNINDLAELAIGIAYEFYNFSSGQREMKEAEALAEKEE